MRLVEYKSEPDDSIFAPFERWDPDGEIFGLVMCGDAAVDPDAEEEIDYASTCEWCLQLAGSDMWEITYSDKEEALVCVYSGRLPTREIFLTVMAHVENAPRWAIDAYAALQGEICPKCGGRMKPGIALTSTYAGEEDDIGGCITLYHGGPGKLIDVIKCEQCGCSIIPKNKNV